MVFTLVDLFKVSDPSACLYYSVIARRQWRHGTRIARALRNLSAQLSDTMFAYTACMFIFFIFIIPQLWPKIKKLTGSSDCGLYTVTNATAICYGVDPTSQDCD